LNTPAFLPSLALRLTPRLGINGVGPSEPSLPLRSCCNLQSLPASRRRRKAARTLAVDRGSYPLLKLGYIKNFSEKLKKLLMIHRRSSLGRAIGPPSPIRPATLATERLATPYPDGSLTRWTAPASPWRTRGYSTSKGQKGGEATGRLGLSALNQVFCSIDLRPPEAPAHG
jgi:hypothetical protein